jgi:rSAM/selenodomain-associated transferase 2
MKISVIIPIFNEEKNLPKIVKWIKSFKHIEFILVDGNSTDNSLNFLQENNIPFLSTAKSKAIQLNYGAKKATGTALFFLHADCDINSQHFKQIETCINNNYIGGAFFTKTLSYKNLFWDFICSFADIQSYYNKTPYGDQGIFCTKEAFIKLAGFKENLPLFEDYDFSKRLKAIGKIKISKPMIIVSGRRYIKWGILKSILIMKGFKIAYKLGISPTKINKFYQDIR